MTWRSLGDSNPCFRRERATPIDCGPFSGVPRLGRSFYALRRPTLSNNIVLTGIHRRLERYCRQARAS